MIELLAPQKPCRRLPEDSCGLFIERPGKLRVKTVRFVLPQIENGGIGPGVAIPICDRDQPKIDDPGLSGSYRQGKTGSHLGAAGAWFPPRRSPRDVVRPTKG